MSSKNNIRKNCCQVWSERTSLIDSDVSPILARKMEEACERRLNSTTSTFNLNDNSLLLITMDVNTRYRLSVFPSELKEKVEKLLQMEVIAQSTWVNVLTLPHINRQRVENHNPQLILIEKIFLVYILLKQRRRSNL